jgi:tetratricopeptide (TPR) repeat protein
MMGHFPRAAPAIVAVFAALVAPPAALGDSGYSGGVPAKARTLAERGRAFHEAGDYASAIAAFTQAYVMAPSPALLFNLAQAYRLQGDCDDAALMYRRYLATSPSPDERALAENHLAFVERCVRKLSLNIPVEVSPGRTAKPSPSDPLAAVASARASSRSAQITQDVGVGLVLGGGAALAAAGYYTVRAHLAASEVADAYANGARWKDVAPIDERGRRAASNARLLGAGAALGVAGGIVTYLIGKRAERPPVIVTSTGRGVELNMSWAY